MESSEIYSSYLWHFLVLLVLNCHIVTTFKFKITVTASTASDILFDLGFPFCMSLLSLISFSSFPCWCISLLDSVRSTSSERVLSQTLLLQTSSCSKRWYHHEVCSNFIETSSRFHCGSGFSCYHECYR